MKNPMQLNQLLNSQITLFGWTRRMSFMSLILGGLCSFAQPIFATSGQWNFTGSLLAPRNGHTATLLADGEVLVAGGYDRAALAGAELYDPGLGTWTVTASLHTNRFSHTATLLTDGRVLV